jgi:hypothetical protein
MNRFEQVKQILDNAVGGAGALIGGPHGTFWRTLSRDQFVVFSILGLPIVTLGQGDASNIVKALRGQAPFGADQGTPAAQFRRMPAGRPPVPDDQILIIKQWIDDGCPETEVPLGTLELTLNDQPSGAGFVIASPAAQPISAILRVRTTDASEGSVTVRLSATSVATLTLSPTTLQVSGQAVEVQVTATSPSGSASQNDTTIEVLSGTDVVAHLDLTVIQTPTVRFTGRFQCRLPTDPDAWDDPWGTNSSFGLYAVQGPNPDDPDEPPLDRIIRFQNGVALRPFCGPIGVLVSHVEADVGGTRVRFPAGDPLIGQAVNIGPTCKFESRNRTFAPDGFEPIGDFSIEIGTAFAGATAPAVPRSSPDDPPGSTAPYADGLYQLDVDITPWKPSDFGYQQATWAERGWALVAIKLAQLVAQQPASDRDTRIRDRRIKEHAPNRLGAISFPVQIMERYTGLIDRNITIGANPTGALAYLATLQTVGFYAEFFDFDTDCQTGTVTGTLGQPLPKPAPQQLRAISHLRRRAPPDQQ